ncbi:MAG TPA: choloylglycine hydrolase, partial [Alistipes sp.]|nr:choloylglycine hydrolase [Alistipes sp.]
MKGGFLCAALLAGALAVAFPERAEACTRVVYVGPDGTVLTARSMDWKEDSRSNLWIFPRGMERSGEVGGNPLTWTSRYGSVVTSAYDICSTDGMS